jgi:hypothetical protein
MPDEAPGSMAAFADAQLADIDLSRIADSTLTLIAVSAFFAGADGEFRRRQESREQKQLAQYIANRFGMGVENATGLIESAHRLAGSYRLMQVITESGREAAGNWIAGDAAAHGDLQDVVTRCNGLSMVDLGIEGVVSVPDTGYPTPTEAVEQGDKQCPARKPRKWLRYILLLVLLIGLLEAAVLYYLFGR